MIDFDLLGQMCDICSVSTDENNIADFLEKKLKNIVEYVYRDRVNNIIAKSSENIDILFFAHMDEIGLIVKNITKEGFIGFEKVGGILDQYLPNQSVIVHGNEAIPGIICWKIKPDLDKQKLKEISVKYQDMYIDTGLSKGELNELNIYPGTLISYKQGTSKYKNNIIAKALDDRVGCFVVLELAKKLSGKISFAIIFTTQEEIGLKGIQTCIKENKLKPKIALEVEITNSSDIPDMYGKPIPISLGKGPVINLADGYEGLIHGFTADRDLLERIRRFKNPNKLQWRIFPGGTSDASIMQLQSSNISTLSVCVPVRYSHTARGIVKITDVNDTIDFIEKFVLHLKASEYFK